MGHCIVFDILQSVQHSHQHSFIKKHIVYSYLLFFMDELASRKG